MLIKEKLVTPFFCEVTNIRTNVHNYSSEFKALLHKMVSKKPFMIQEIYYMNGNCERKIFTVSQYIKEFFSRVEIEDNKMSLIL